MMTFDKKTIQREFFAGLSTFLTMSYIIIVNPSILSTEGTGMPFSGVLSATVLLSFLMTLAMGLYAKLPFAVAPGMGINAFFTFSLILGEKIPWQTALGIVFWSGVLFIALSLTPFRVKLAEAIPQNIRLGAAVGIGLFLSFIGFKNAGWVVSDPVTFVKMGTFSGSTWASFAGLVLMLFLLRKKNPLAFVSGIALVSGISLAMGWIHLPQTFWSPPDFSSVFLKLDIWGAFKLSLLPAILSILFTDLFDSISTFVGVSQSAKLLDEKGQPLRMKQGLLVDAFATMSAGLFGTSAGTAYIESAAGIEVGGRTGLTSVFCALLFLPCLFIAPLVSMVPAYATAPVLMLVGFLMFKNVKDLRLEKLEEAVPAFLTLLLIPLTFSITKGLLWGFLSHVILFLIAGRRQELSPTLWALGALSASLLFWI